ncbi:hypothetical protein [Parabacteroides distasonis]|uniref:hypothetical protein n=1 Tax=Parabacteroides distasonis TaxID=823 RepID=UPI003219EB8B
MRKSIHPIDDSSSVIYSGTLGDLFQMLPNIPSASYSVNIWCIGKGGMGGNAGNGWGLYKGGAGGAGANGGVLCVSSSIKYSDNIKLEYTNDDGTYGAKVSSNKFTLKAYNGGNGENGTNASAFGGNGDGGTGGAGRANKAEGAIMVIHNWHDPKAPSGGRVPNSTPPNAIFSCEYTTSYGKASAGSGGSAPTSPSPGCIVLELMLPIGFVGEQVINQIFIGDTKINQAL